ncbi:MAG: sulfurtransferase TusA family protein [Desulfarculaceae bacterium]|nr:sulfurtransferase TusA family protein [Desulfarculaceae bacterium]MCF8047470.1 sulfurtransferase TusA family protein [Desulfarculaceae bacterium]MCF8063979.1 sulfurtransferase TusA family protein [Desulfarculaceae bacterium]MCF8097018.1 sulfurtransferase TusA family protein [Desulfarculaceae bacterium]MCF8122070.1 sulfurtransferase TusA family protein [Desulfarculaceae bacterium]
MSDINAAKVLDLKGLPCPMPVVKMSQEIGSVNVGDVIEVHTTDPGSLSDFPAWAETSGNEVLDTEQGGEFIKIFVKRNS